MSTYTKEEVKDLTKKSKKWLENEKSHPPGQEAVDELIEVINFHEWRYYVKNDPIISDYEYDQLFKLLEKMEAEHPAYLRSWSPTQRVSSDLTSDFPTVRHLVPMLSLGNSYNEEDLYDFDRQVRKVTEIGPEEPLEYSVEPKFDGGSISLVYENDLLVRAATRGNGEEGDEITANARVMQSVPLKASFQEHGIVRAEIRGEAIIRKDEFLKINKEREENGLELFANPRNAATGGLRMKDPAETAKRGIQTFLYQMGYAEDVNGANIVNTFDTHEGTLRTLGKLGFKIPADEIKVCRNIAEVVEYCREWEDKRDDYPYEIDGMVVKVNRLALHEKAGSTAHHPRWAIAFKFKAKQATTILEKVVYQVGKLGTITPVAKVKPVSLAGVTISSISMHNEDFIVSKDLRIGDHVLIERAGDVIPYIVKALPDLREGDEVPIEFPENCPINPDPNDPVKLEKSGDEAAWRCNICHCGAQDLQRAIFYVSKSAMDIDGLGGSILKRFSELGWVNDIADLYRLDYDKIAELEGWGEKSVENLRQSVEESKSRPLWRLLVGLSIPQMGQRASKLLAARITHAMDLKDWTEEDFTSIRDIGPILAKNIREWFSIERNVEMLRRMEDLGVNLSQTEEDKPVEKNEDGALYGKSILFTGSLEQMTRNEAKELAEKAGARNISAVSSKLDILVVGANAGSKLKKAQDLGTVEIMTEDEFLGIVMGD